MATLVTINICSKERPQLSFNMNNRAALQDRALPCSWAEQAQQKLRTAPSCEHAISSQCPPGSQQDSQSALPGAKASLEQLMQSAERSTCAGILPVQSRELKTSLAMVQNACALLMGQSGTPQASLLVSHDSWGAFHNIGCITFLSWRSGQSCWMEKTHLKNSFFPDLGQSRDKLKDHVRIREEWTFPPSSCSLKGTCFLYKTLKQS